LDTASAEAFLRICQQIAADSANRVVAAEKLAEEADALAQRLASGPTFAYGMIKHLMRTSQERTLRDQLDEEQRSFLACNETGDFEAGGSAFFTKRPAIFHGS